MTYAEMKLDLSYEAREARNEAARAAISAFRAQQEIQRIWDVRNQLTELSWKLGHR